MEVDKKPLMSVCIPVYNGAHLIPKALESAIAQTYRNIEIVVVDDASTDNTIQVVENYMARDPRIKLFKNEKNLGLAPNWHRAIECGIGKFAEVLCADDWWDQNYVEVKLKAFEKYPDIGFVECGVTTFMDVPGGEPKFMNRDLKQGGVWNADYVFRNFYKRDGIIGSFCTARREDLLKNFVVTVPNDYGYDALYRKGKIIDNLPFLLVLAKYKKMYYAADTMHYALEHTAQFSKQFGLDVRSVEDDIKFAHIDLVGFEWFFKNNAQEYLKGFRIFKGTQILVSTIFDYATGRAVGSTRGMLGVFFENYSRWEKFLVTLRLPLHFVRRSVVWISKRLTNRLN